MNSGEERREVAARLRALDVFDLGDAGNVIDTPEESGALFARILYMVNDYRPGLHYATSHFVARAAVDLFADLIDPTCEAEPMDDYVPSHAFSRWRCKSCGAVSFAPRTFGMPRFCPHCGARVLPLKLHDKVVSD